ncbi:hypothetical protein BP6252_05611 [Coleophoma cylindrospora]|uniref:Uncharacterized protein n=1 Tax=Coleophoma cylindrospora TaxID=1849047 RepID=A0A3D8RUB8_9HELO|nr:hypothetical protein BP6252_05611 [Coleophoma cylindrospora]
MPPSSMVSEAVNSTVTVVIPASTSIPLGALPVSIVVLLYTAISLSAGLLLIYLLWSHERRFTYVAILAVLVSLSTAVSMTQQIHFAVDWKNIKAGQYAMRGKLDINASRAISNGSHGLDLGLFWIQFYTYNADALLVLFWATSLFLGTWRINPKMAWLGPLENHIETCSKVFGLVFPAVLLSVAQINPIAGRQIIFAIVCNACLVLSATIGAVLIILTLFKFIQSRRLLNGSTFSSNGRSQGNNYGTGTGTGTGTGEHAARAKKAQRAIDRSIIMRFTVAFVLLSIFEVVDIVLEILSFRNAQVPAGSLVSDYQASSAIADVVAFIPGVTCSLVAWAIWGTTRKYLKQTRELFASIFCCCCNGRRATRRSDSANMFEMGLGKSMTRSLSMGTPNDHFCRLSEGKDGAQVTVTGGGRHAIRNSLKEMDIRVETELTVMESASESDEEAYANEDGKGSNGLRPYPQRPQR